MLWCLAWYCINSPFFCCQSHPNLSNPTWNGLCPAELLFGLRSRECAGQLWTSKSLCCCWNYSRSIFWFVAGRSLWLLLRWREATAIREYPFYERLHMVNNEIRVTPTLTFIQTLSKAVVSRTSPRGPQSRWVFFIKESGLPGESVVYLVGHSCIASF